MKKHPVSLPDLMIPALMAATLALGFSPLRAQTPMPIGSEVIGTGAALTTGDIQTLQTNALGTGITFDVGPNPATTRPMPMLCGLVPPAPAELNKVQANAPVTVIAVPAQWDWRQHGGDVAVRDQGYCGGCWAFATVAPLECNIKIKDGVETNLSEQYLVSCNTRGASCSGGWFVHDMHVSPGAVLESCFPYTASDAPCQDGCAHPYHLKGWGYVAGSESAMPTVDQLKSAIYQYGPISAAVAVDSYFQAYTSGVFNRSYTGRINHGVTLVGWDDAIQCWILRNSWSAGWGDKGYMYIKYGCSSVGYGAAYVDYVAANASNLVAYYPFSGNTLDRSSHALHGVNHGATLTSDRFGNPNSAYYFNGGAYISVPGCATLNGMDSFTLSAWVKADTYSYGYYGVILSKVSPNRDFVFDLHPYAGGSLNVHCAEGSNYSIGWATTPKVPLNIWSHVAAVYTGTSWQIYLDGVLAKETAITGPKPLWTGTSMEIGSLLDYTGCNFKGAIDEVRIYDKALTPEEISELMWQ